MHFLPKAREPVWSACFQPYLVALTLSHYSWIPLSQGLVVKRWSGLSWSWAFCTCYFLFLKYSCSLHTASFASFFRSQFEGYQPQEACGGSKLRPFICSYVIPFPTSTCYICTYCFFVIVYSVVCLLIKNTSTISVLITTVYPESIIPPPGMWQLHKHLLNKLMKSVHTLHLCYWNCCVLELLRK